MRRTDNVIFHCMISVGVWHGRLYNAIIQTSMSVASVTLQIQPFNLGGHGACRWCRSTSSIRTSTLKFLGLTVRKIWHILCACVSRLVTLTFYLLTLKLVRNVARVTGYRPAYFGDTTTITWLITWHCDLDLWRWRTRRLRPMRVVVLHQYTKFEYRIGLGIRKIRRTMCVSINGPGDLDLWLFDLKNGMRVASKVWKLPSKFGKARPLGSRIVRYVRDEQTKTLS